MGLGSRIIDEPTHNIEDNEIIIAHGLWQWPGSLAWKNHRINNTKYLLFPHGMLGPMV